MAETTIAPNNRAIVFRGQPLKERAMPWDAASFKSKHNHSLSKGEAGTAAKQATAMVNAGVPEGISIATANKHINKLRKRGVVSAKASKRHLGKYGGTDQEPIDASSR
jgi:hypothetical protein